MGNVSHCILVKMTVVECLSLGQNTILVPKRVEVANTSLDLTGKILILTKEDLESWMSATERLATPLYTEKSSWYCSLNAWKVQF